MGKSIDDPKSDNVELRFFDTVKSRIIDMLKEAGQEKKHSPKMILSKGVT